MQSRATFRVREEAEVSVTRDKDRKILAATIEFTDNSYSPAMSFEQEFRIEGLTPKHLKRLKDALDDLLAEPAFHKAVKNLKDDDDN